MIQVPKPVAWEGEVSMFEPTEGSMYTGNVVYSSSSHSVLTAVTMSKLCPSSDS